MDRGGAELRTVDVMSLLVKDNVLADYCTLTPETSEGDLDEEIRNAGGNVIRCPLKPDLLKFHREFTSLLKLSHYDIVHSHVHYASGGIVWLARKSGIKGRIVHFRNTDDGGDTSIKRAFYRSSMRYLIRKNATGVLAVCNGAMEANYGKNWRKDNRARVIYNGLDPNKFNPAENNRLQLLSALNLEADCKVVLNVAHIHRQKGHDILMRAARKVIGNDPRVCFLIAGDGVLRGEMETLSKTLGIDGHVRFLGLRNDIPNLLKSADCFILTSRWEGLPGVVLEATASGLPVVASDLPGVREIAEEAENIKVAPVGDFNSFADGVMAILGKKRKLSITYPEKFKLESSAKALLYFYKRQLASKDGRNGQAGV